MVKRGLLIVFEGCDRVGKSTQVRMLGELFDKANLPNIIMQFPNRTSPSGRLIDLYLRHKQQLPPEELRQLFSENRLEECPLIRKLLLNGVHVIVDRYSYSGIVYAVANNCDWMRAVRSEQALIKPDVVFLIFLPLPELQKRLKFEEKYETFVFQKKVAAGFMQFPYTSIQKGLQNPHVMANKFFQICLNEIEIKQYDKINFFE